MKKDISNVLTRGRQLLVIVTCGVNKCFLVRSHISALSRLTRPEVRASCRF
jgi:hypothetical protein